MALKSLSSASLAMSAMGWASPWRNPPLRSRRTSLSSLSPSCVDVKPHQAGDAYSMEARVVMRATLCTWVGPRPCDWSISRAWTDGVHDDSSSSMWHSIVRFPVMTTPSMCMEVTLVARCRNRLATEPVRSLRLLTTSWRVLDGLSWRLLVRAQAFMWANSSPCGLPTQCSTGQFWPACIFSNEKACTW